MPKKKPRKARKSQTKRRRRASHQHRAARRVSAPKLKAVDRASAHPTAVDPAGYQQIKERARTRNAELSRSGRDIAPIPPIVNPDRRARCQHDFAAFLASYCGGICHRPPSPDVLEIIQLMQGIVLGGGRQAEAEPRGFGKSTRARLLCLWAILYGHRRFVVLVGKNGISATQNLKIIKRAIETNPLLLEDFPEAIYPIRKLEGIANRCQGQHCAGARTYVQLKARQLVLPTIEGAASSGAVFWSVGINSSEIRGLSYELPGGGVLRPDLVVLDDVQDRRTAVNPLQVDKAEETINADVLGMAGRDRGMAALMPCTVISPGDLADRFLDRDKRPDWNGRRLSLLKSMPANMRLWDEYRAVRAESIRAGQGHSWATKFYQEHRADMDAGAVAAWPEVHEQDEISAIQHAMNRWCRDEQAFWAEDQNQPRTREIEEEQLDADTIRERINRLQAGLVPVAASHLVAFIDVQKTLLYYLVLGVDEGFGGSVLEYGTYPGQGRHYFSLRDANPTLQRAAPGAHWEGAIYAGLGALTRQLLKREWPREGGGGVRIGRCLIDANYQPDLVHQFCRESEQAALLIPSRGRYFGAGATPLSEWQKRPGERVGLNWRLGKSAKRVNAHVLFDSNFWKTLVAARLTTALGDRGAWSLYGDRPEVHRLLCEHLTAEKRKQVSVKGRTIDEWILRPGRENHWFDCLVGCAVAASIDGAALLGDAKPARRRVRYSELQTKGRRQ